MKNLFVMLQDVEAESINGGKGPSSNAGVAFPDNDVDPLNDGPEGLIIEDVMDVRQDGDRGRDSDVDVENFGTADISNSFPQGTFGSRGKSDVGFNGADVN